MQLVVSSDKPKRSEDKIITPAKATVEDATTEPVGQLTQKKYDSWTENCKKNIEPKPKPEVAPKKTTK